MGKKAVFDKVGIKKYEQIKISCLKHRGNIIQIAKDVGMSEEEIKDIVDKLKKEEHNEHGILVAQNIMSHLQTGIQSRIFWIMEMLSKLKGKDVFDISDCCKVGIRIEKINETEKQICSKCLKECMAIPSDRMGVFDLQLRLIEALREEDKALVEFAAKMGFINTENNPLFCQNNKQTNIFINGEKKVELTKDDEKNLQMVEALSPKDRGKVLKALEDSFRLGTEKKQS